MIDWYLNSALSTPGLLEGLANVYALIQARVEALGGQILFWNGVRVMGVLAVSRSIGDHCMRPFVIPDPEVHLPDPFVSCVLWGWLLALGLDNGHLGVQLHPVISLHKSACS